MAKATKKQVLGRGLSALLKDPSNDIKSITDKNANQVVGNIIDLDLKVIEMNPFQPRSRFNEESLRELASSIKELGVIQPITVRKIEFNKFQLVSGERRFRASKLIGKDTIPAFIRIANDQESLEMALVENIQRQDLDPIEIGLSYQRLIEEIEITQEELSNRVGKNRSTIANYLRLLKLDPIIQTGMRDAFISMGHGRAIINVLSSNEQLYIYEKVISENLSVRETEALVRSLKSETKKDTFEKKIVLPNYLKTAKKELSEYLSSRVSINSSGANKGIVTIPFKNKKDFYRILNLLKSEK
jgi:ParB family chromosome partitioning protein